MLSKQVIVLFISFMCVSLHGCGEEKSSDSDVGEAAGANSNLTAPEAPVDCQLSAWEDAKDSSGVCTATCGGGVKTQERTVIQEPAFGGSECGSLKQDIPCNTKACPQWRQMQKSPAQCSPRFRAYLQASRYWTQEMLQAQCEADDDCVGYYWDTELKRGDGCKSVKIDPGLADAYWYPEDLRPNSTFYPDPKALADVGDDGCVGKDGHFPSGTWGTCFSSVAEESDGDRLNSNGEVDKSTDIIYS